MRATHLIVLALAFLALALVGLETTASRHGQISRLDQMTLSVFSPFQKAFFSLGNWMADLAHASSLREENQMLSNENFMLKKRMARLQQAEIENRNLRAMLRLSPALPRKWIEAEVISRDPSEWFQKVTLNRGRAEGVTENNGVVGAGGVVGKITEIGEHVSRVMLLLDPRLAIPVQILPSGAEGVLYGSGRQTCLVKYVAKDLVIHEGDRVVTSGYGHLFEKGIPVGTVVQIGSGSDPLFKLVEVKPDAQINGLLTVFVFQP